MINIPNASTAMAGGLGRLVAEDLAAAGVPVFPCRADKRPACPNGFKNASLDVEAVRDLWFRYPGPLIGVPTGAASGIDVLDIDPRHGGDRWWIGHMHRIPATRMHRTGSGGLHVLFRQHEKVRNTASKIAPGVDTRALGGYIVWWPAAGCGVAEAPLAHWPTWLVRRLLKVPKQAKIAGEGFTPLDSTDAAQRAAERVLRQLELARPGTFHLSVRKAGWTIGGLLDRLPFGEEEAKRRIVEAVGKAGATARIAHEKTAAWALARGQLAPLGLRGDR